eukprot:TRINITY_DN23590_c0_g1_i3.p1 TRINITY_DN23590_c0_g1~~TRINITY_DN23590_c0_g1_i3.p1  ORF type:complete len:285 (-),score=64.89 TRINITY_DN23590_c0_g1_i3:66-920(-)
MLILVTNPLLMSRSRPMWLWCVIWSLILTFLKRTSLDMEITRTERLTQDPIFIQFGRDLERQSTRLEEALEGTRMFIDTSILRASAGIENVNSGNEPFTDEQVKTNVALVRHLVIDFDIPEENVIGHGDYTYRKIDPGPYFHTIWERFGKTKHKIGRSIGRYSYVHRHKHPEMLIDNTGTVVGSNFNVEILQQDLQVLGYPTGDIANSTQVNENTRNAILEFTLRYMGKDIVEDETLKAAYEALWASSTEGVDVLKVWTSNHQRILDDLLLQEKSVSVKVVDES